MDLVEVGTIGAEGVRRLLQGASVVNVVAGKHFRIEISPSGEEVLDAAVPDGKAWAVNVTVTVTETDA